MKSQNATLCCIKRYCRNSFSKPVLQYTYEILSCFDNRLQSLDVSACPNLTNLYVSYDYLQEDGTYLVKANDLSVLDLSNNHMLETILCFDNQLTNLTLACSNHLKSLYCAGNQLSSLNLAGYTVLEELSCLGNRLYMLDLSNCTSLRKVYCYYNSLTSLNVSGCSALLLLWCHYNNLTSLDVSACTGLKELLTLGNPQLALLDIRSVPTLRSLVMSMSPTKYTDATVYETEEAVLAIDHNTRLSY